MKDIYDEYRSYENDVVRLKPVEVADANELLQMFRDEASRKFFNIDNFPVPCFYDTLERVQEEMEFYLTAYRGRFFVRWSVVDLRTNTVVGTIENFNRQALLEDGSPRDYFHGKGLLRVDLKSSHENREFIGKLLDVILAHGFEDFHCEEIATKAIPEATERIAALLAAGFHKAEETILGFKGEHFGDYFVIGKEDVHGI